MLESFIHFSEDLVLSLDPAFFTISLIVSVLASLFSFYSMYEWYRQAMMMIAMPSSKIRSAVQGHIELIGKTRMMEGPLIISPLSQKKCVWFKYKVEEKAHRDNDRISFDSNWEVIQEQTSDELFLIEDETGQCVIDPDHATVMTDNKRVWFHRGRRYTEALIYEHETLYAMGLFESLDNVERQKQEEDIRYILRAWKQDQATLLARFDHNNDGKIDQEEWADAQQVAQEYVEREQGLRTKLAQLHVLKTSPHRDQSFILSTLPEQSLIKQYQLKALFYLAIFLLSGSLIVWAINVRLAV